MIKALVMAVAVLGVATSTALASPDGPIELTDAQLGSVRACLKIQPPEKVGIS
jgi:hypothetical protein